MADQLKENSDRELQMPPTFLTTGPFVIIMVVLIRQYIDRMLRFQLTNC